MYALMIGLIFILIPLVLLSALCCAQFSVELVSNSELLFLCNLFPAEGVMADVGVKSGDKVLLIWAQPSAPSALRQFAEELGAVAGAQGRVSVENLDRLLLCELPFASSLSPFLDRTFDGF